MSRQSKLRRIQLYIRGGKIQRGSHKVVESGRWVVEGKATFVDLGDNGESAQTGEWCANFIFPLSPLSHQRANHPFLSVLCRTAGTTEASCQISSFATTPTTANAKSLVKKGNHRGTDSARHSPSSLIPFSVGRATNVTINVMRSGSSCAKS